MVPLFLRPRDGFMLCFERRQHVVRMILYNIILNVRALSPPLWPRFNVHIRQYHLPLGARLGRLFIRPALPHRRSRRVRIHS